jgi:hypothetical protein
MIVRCTLLYHLQDSYAGQATLTGIVRSFVEDNGAKAHAHLIAPQVKFITERFERRVDTVEIIRYPHKADGVTGRPALIARYKNEACRVRISRSSAGLVVQ